MIDPTGGFLTTILVKVVDLIGDDLAANLSENKNKRRDVLLDMFAQMKAIEAALDGIITEINDLLMHDADSKFMTFSWTKTPAAIHEIRRALRRLARDLKKVAPGFEIMASDAAKTIQSYHRGDWHYIDDLQRAFAPYAGGARSSLWPLRKYKPFTLEEVGRKGGMNSYYAQRFTDPSGLRKALWEAEQIRDQAQIARDKIEQFIRDNYTWATIGN